APPRRRRDPRHVAVQRTLIRGAEERNGGAEHLDPVERAHDVATRLGEGAKNLHRHGGVRRLPRPGRVEECPDLGETLEIGHRPHLDPRTARGRVSLLRRIEQATPCLLPAHPSRSRLSPSSDSTSPSRSAVRSGMCCTSTCSSSPWAPPPTAPRPSSV